MHNLRNYIAEVILFINGGVIMALELLGVRILAPYVGTTLAVWANLIGVILGALGLGYYLGGVLGDRRRHANILGALMCGAAMSILAIVVIKNNVEAAAQFFTSPGVGALYVSSVLFLIPTVLLGMITAYTIRLQTSSLITIGSIHGRLYGFSTVGSLLGIFITGFYLVPHYSTSTILFILAAVLAGASYFAFGLHTRAFEDSRRG